MKLKDTHIAVIGLGYVGLPLAVELGRKYHTIGFDKKNERIIELKEGVDSTGEVESGELKEASLLKFSSDSSDLKKCNVYIVAVPTPIDGARTPDLMPLIRASEMIGSVISKGDVVIYESTVYPGATEEDCIPVIEKVSGLKFNEDFFAGYSPERINPGDKNRPLTSIVKVTSGSTPDIADFVDALYASIITAGTFKASSIRVAEAAKVIENTQRDVNIALVNELSMIFSRIGLDTNEVIDAASTKWNFINMRPGLVGGHCIGVDPYYLVHKSMSVGFIPDIIRRSREINDGMARNSASLLVNAMISKGNPIKDTKVLILGFTFKENCPDLRNTKVFDLIGALEAYGMSCDIYDDWVQKAETDLYPNINFLNDLPDQNQYEAVILAVKHDNLVQLGSKKIKSYLKEKGIFFDLKAAFPASESDLRL